MNNTDSGARRNLFQSAGNMYALAGIEFRGMLKQPLYYVLAAIATLLIYFSKDFTMFSFDWGSGDDPNYLRTMIREMGLATMFMAGMFMALLSASRSIYNEIENKTALTVLSKPVSRNDFILGKFFGIIAGILPMFLFLGLILFLAIRIQSGSDVRDGLIDRAIWEFGIFKGVYITYLKAAVLTALSVAISTRFPFLTNLMITSAAFIVCHLLNYLNSYFIKVEGLMFYILQLLYALFLNLENFNYFYQGDPPPLPSAYLIFLVTLYTIIYTSILLIIANISFSKRDLF